MAGQRGKYVAPSVKETAFNCPHCGALTTQTWYSTHAEGLRKNGLPSLEVFDADLEKLIAQIQDEKERESITKLAKRRASGVPFIRAAGEHIDFVAENVWISRCYNCSELAIWLYGTQIWPKPGDAPPPHNDLPEDLRPDYLEASSILNLSPRGSAALLRLVMQKLCVHLGEKGENLNDDIASLVRKGLDPAWQKAFDSVRVIGANAVHPLQMDLQDDHATAESLFELVNVVVDAMIARHKRIDEVYKKLPQVNKEAIAKRDGKKGDPK